MSESGVGRICPATRQKLTGMGAECMNPAAQDGMGGVNAPAATGSARVMVVSGNLRWARLSQLAPACALPQATAKIRADGTSRLGSKTVISAPQGDHDTDGTWTEGAVHVDQVDVRSRLVAAQDGMTVEHVLGEERQIDASAESRTEPEVEEVRPRKLDQPGRISLVVGVFGGGRRRLPAGEFVVRAHVTVSFPGDEVVLR